MQTYIELQVVVLTNLIEIVEKSFVPAMEPNQINATYNLKYKNLNKSLTKKPENKLDAFCVGIKINVSVLKTK